MSPLINCLSMGKYSAYVWPCYGLVVVVLLMHCVAIKWQQRRVNKRLQQWFKR